ncbi:hypothetical protein H9W95_10245 [Flavobacterium lindanitolerans]|nr:hypothetical protein [Flavobacterium lindanitolerans]
MAVNGSFAGDYKIVTGNVILNDSDFYIAYNGNTNGIIQLPMAISGRATSKDVFTGLRIQPTIGILRLLHRIWKK